MSWLRSWTVCFGGDRMPALVSGFKATHFLTILVNQPLFTTVSPSVDLRLEKNPIIVHCRTVSHIFCVSLFQLPQCSFIWSLYWLKYSNPSFLYNLEYSRCLLHPFIHIYEKFSLKYLVSLETLRFLLEFKIKFWGFEQCLAAQHEFVMTDPSVGFLRRLKDGWFSDLCWAFWMHCRLPCIEQHIPNTT